MRSIETIQYMGKQLSVFVESFPDDESKGAVSYYIDGIEIKDWGKLSKPYARILSAMADNVCEYMGVKKFSY